MKEELFRTVEKTVDAATGSVKVLESGFESKARPLRESVLTRFPALFVLMTTFGVTAVLYGFEGLIAQVSFLSERPLLILAIGVMVLAFTGSLYAKLGQK